MDMLEDTQVSDLEDLTMSIMSSQNSQQINASNEEGNRIRQLTDNLSKAQKESPINDCLKYLSEKIT